MSTRQAFIPITPVLPQPVTADYRALDVARDHAGTLLDRLGRPLRDLRISVTDRCNLRCVYCMPPEGVEWQTHENILRYEEIGAVVRAAASYGIREIRLSGQS